MDETLKLLVTIIGAGSGTAFITAIIKGIGNMRSGAARREQVKNTSLATKAAKAEAAKEKAEAELEAEILKRREAEEDVAKLQRQVILLGVEPVVKID